MPSKRDAILDGTLEAARLHGTLDIQNRIDVFGGRIDVFAAIIDRGAQLVFRKLDGLLGAYVPAEVPGILITSERNLAIQRYTGGHELGHYCMNHSGSIDEEDILHRSSITSAKYDTNEVAADAFSSEFLMPEWLVEYHAKRQGWSMDSLADVVNAYQLSLRVGLSFEATCRILQNHNLLTRSGTDKLLSIKPKQIKQQLLSGHSMADWHANVWFLTEKDEGAAIFGEPNDVFVVRLREHTGSGYLWNIDQVAKAGFVVVADERQLSTGRSEIGGPVERTITAHSGEPKLGNIDFTEARPWDKSDVFGRLSFAYDLRGKEQGLPRAMRERLVAA
jgi:Zn-dependent peptidase ImmA (M78 family)